MNASPNILCKFFFHLSLNTRSMFLLLFCIVFFNTKKKKKIFCIYILLKPYLFVIILHLIELFLNKLCFAYHVSYKREYECDLCSLLSVMFMFTSLQKKNILMSNMFVLINSMFDLLAILQFVFTFSEMDAFKTTVNVQTFESPF